MNQTQDFATESWPISRPKPYPKNARKWSQKAIEKVAASIREFGWRQPLVCDAEDVIVIGHLRLAAAQFLGLEQVPVHVARDLSPAKVRALRLADNRLHEEAQWDEGLLREDMLDLKGLDLDLSLTGFSSRELDALTLTPSDKADECPEVPKWAVTKPGDLWLMGDHRLLCGDSTEAVEVAGLMESALADLVFTDPPYGVGYDGGTTKRAKLIGDESTDLYAPCCLMAAAFSKRGAALYLWHAGVKGIAAAAAAAAAGYQIRCELVWNKNLAQFGSLSAQYKQKHEPCYYCFRGTPQWYGPTNEVTVWDCNRSSVNEFHPTQKPVEIVARALANSSKAGDIVLDLFGGSGSTLIGCEETGRAARLVEIAPEYCDVIVSRWQNFTGREAKLDGHGATFAQVKDGRLREWEDAIKEEVLNVQT